MGPRHVSGARLVYSVIATTCDGRILKAGGQSMRDDLSVIALVARVSDGDQRAWDELVERYSPLVWSICFRYQLTRQDIDDVGQSVWLLLVEQVGKLREPAALPGWIATTTKRECLRALRTSLRHDHGALPPNDQLQANAHDPSIDH